MNGRPTTIGLSKSDTANSPPVIPERRPKSSNRPSDLKPHKPERFPPKPPALDLRNTGIPAKPPLALRNSGGEERNYSKLIKEGNFLIIDGKEYKTVKTDLVKIRDLGKGTCGSVVLMKHKKTDVNIAVKQMVRRNNSAENKRINRDLMSILKCQSNYIVICLGTILDENEAWLCMEEMATCLEKLYTRLLPKLIPENIIGQVALSTVKALDYLKVQHKIIHRDIKPSNILLNVKGEIKLCDFGISGYLENSIAVTNNQDNNAYTAPELINKSEHDEFDSRPDVWSLAISLLELSIGMYPYFYMYPNFKDMKMFAKLVTILEKEAPKLPEDSGFSQAYQDFITSSLNKKVTDRPKFKQLLNSEFLIACENDKQVNVAEWFGSL